MRKFEEFSRTHLKSFWLGIFILSGFSLIGDPAAIFVRSGTSSVALAQPQPQTQTQPLSANDVSWLFPPPTRAEDFAKLIAVGDIAAPNSQDPTKRDPVWSDAAFQQFIGIAASPAGAVAGTTNRIGLPSEIQTKSAWFVAGIRIDAGAPGLSNVIAQYGQSPQIRLIVQPVLRATRMVRPNMLDIAGHLIFDFTAGLDAPAQAGCFPSTETRPRCPQRDRRGTCRLSATS